MPAAERDRPGLLALDVSKRAIGVAGADAGWRLATPLATIRRRRWAEDLERLETVIRERAAGVARGSAGRSTWTAARGRAVRRCARSPTGSMSRSACRSCLWDERLAAFAAEEAAERAGLRGKKRAEMLDALAATAVLQDLLNTLARRPPRLVVEI